MKENRFTRHLSVKIVIAFGILSIALTIFSSLVYLFGAYQDDKYMTLLFGVIQNLFVFALSAVLMAKICYKEVARPLKLDVAPTWKGIGMVVLLYLASFPALNWLVDWNMHITFPDSMHDLYTTLKKIEDMAQEQTKFMLKGNDFFTMVLMVLMVGVLTGFGEEIFFRGALLGAFERKRSINIHESVWTVGILFSAFHFQFFGFFPRCYLGILLGYLFVWSRSLWLPVVCHALNNSLVVITYYLSEQKVVNADAIDKIGIPQNGEFPILALTSAVATVALIYATSKVLKSEHAANAPKEN